MIAKQVRKPSIDLAVVPDDEGGLQFGDHKAAQVDYSPCHPGHLTGFIKKGPLENYKY
jgi:hypothetical protein